MNRRSFVKLFGAFLGALPVAKLLPSQYTQEEVVEDMWKGEFLGEWFQEWCEGETAKNFPTLEEKKLAYLAFHLNFYNPFEIIEGFVDRGIHPLYISDWNAFVEHPLDPELVEEALAWIESAYRDWPPLREKLYEWKEKMLKLYGDGGKRVR